MKKTSFILVLLFALLVSGCTATPKKKSKNKSSSIFDSSESILSESDVSSISHSQAPTSTNPTSRVSSSQEKTNSHISSGSTPISSVGPISSASSPISSSVPVSSASSPTSSSSQSSSVTPPSGDLIEGIMIEQPYIKAKVGKTSYSATVRYYLADGVDENDVDKSVTWKTGDTSKATVDKYGQVTGVARGKTTLTCITVVGNKTSTVEIYVLNQNEEFEEKLLKITNTTINPGDDIVIAASQFSVAAGEDDKDNYLNPEQIELSGDKSEILNRGKAAMFKVLDDKKGRGGLVLEDPDRNGDKFLGVSNVSNVNFYASNNTTQTLWDITWDTSQACWDMRAYKESAVDGWMMYNSQAQRFTTYKSGASSTMHVIDIYRMTMIVEI